MILLHLPSPILAITWVPSFPNFIWNMRGPEPKINPELAASVGKHLPSKKRCFLNSEHKNSMNISPFLWCCLAAASKYFPQNMVVCFHNIFFVIWYKCILYLVCVNHLCLLSSYWNMPHFLSLSLPQKAEKVQSLVNTLVIPEIHAFSLQVLSFCSFTLYKIFVWLRSLSL